MPKMFDKSKIFSEDQLNSIAEWIEATLKLSLTKILLLGLDICLTQVGSHYLLQLTAKNDLDNLKEGLKSLLEGAGVDVSTYTRSKSEGIYVIKLDQKAINALDARMEAKAVEVEVEVDVTRPMMG